MIYQLDIIVNHKCFFLHDYSIFVARGGYEEVGGRFLSIRTVDNCFVEFCSIILPREGFGP